MNVFAPLLNLLKKKRAGEVNIDAGKTPEGSPLTTPTNPIRNIGLNPRTVEADNPVANMPLADPTGGGVYRTNISPRVNHPLPEGINDIADLPADTPDPEAPPPFRLSPRTTADKQRLLRTNPLVGPETDTFGRPTYMGKKPSRLKGLLYGIARGAGENARAQTAAGTANWGSIFGGAVGGGVHGGVDPTIILKDRRERELAENQKVLDDERQSTQDRIQEESAGALIDQRRAQAEEIRQRPAREQERLSNETARAKDKEKADDIAQLTKMRDADPAEFASLKREYEAKWGERMPVLSKSKDGKSSEFTLGHPEDGGQTRYRVGADGVPVPIVSTGPSSAFTSKQETIAASNQADDEFIERARGDAQIYEGNAANAQSQASRLASEAAALSAQAEQQRAIFAENSESDPQKALAAGNAAKSLEERAKARQKQADEQSKRAADFESRANKARDEASKVSRERKSRPAPRSGGSRGRIPENVIREKGKAAGLSNKEIEEAVRRSKSR